MSEPCWHGSEGEIFDADVTKKLKWEVCLCFNGEVLKWQLLQILQKK